MRSLKQRQQSVYRCSALRSGLVLALAGAVYCIGFPNRSSSVRHQSTDAPESRTSAPHRAASIRSVGWFGLSAGSSDARRSCAARQTQASQFGPIRLIEVGDEIAHLAGFFRSTQHDAAARHERCLVIASLAGCPSCAAIGFSLASGQFGRVLGPLTIVRVDVDEFAEELRELGVSPSLVPGFALLDGDGGIDSVLEGSDWPGNDPGEFLPLLSNFVRGEAIHQRGGRHSEPNRGSLEL